MKVKTATRIVNAVENGYQLYPLHTIRKAALRLGRPVGISTLAGNILYYPIGITGEFARVYSRNYSCSIEKKQPWTSKYDLLTEKPGDLRLNVSAGASISYTCNVASQYATYLKAVVSFEFNGVEVFSRPYTSWHEAEKNWNRESERKHQEYLNSDEHKARLEERTKKIAIKQTAINILLAELPSLINDEAKIMNWVSCFAKVADDVGVEFDKKELSKTLQNAGWVNNAYAASIDASDEEKEELKAQLNADKSMLAQYIMGQVISCLEINMPPHPVTSHFVSEYFGTQPDPDEDYDEDDEDYDDEDDLFDAA